MQIRECNNQDVPQLAVMNKHLIEEEKSNNPMSVEELEQRMLGFLNSEYKAYLFMEDKTVLGYALVRHTSTPFYLRQFYIKREFRRQHYGKTAFEQLMKYIQADTIDMDVLPWNERGRLFWKSCGFEETCISMRYERN